MSDDRRILRVEREIKERLSQILLSELKIPLPGFVSIVEVKASPDLRNAKVYVRVAGTDKDRSEAETILMDQRAWIQGQVAKDLKLRFNPVLKFLIGGSTPGPVDEVEELLANLHRRRA